MLRKFLPLVMLVLALMPALAQAQSPGSGKGQPRQLAAAAKSQMIELKEGIDFQRTATWRWQDMALMARSRTNYSERRADNPSYLRWVAKLWNNRRQTAKERVQTILGQRGYLPPERARVLGSVMAAQLYGWTGQQWRCLDALWGSTPRYGTLESGWRVWADNPSSEAGGIPQANPASKMSSAGPNWARSAYTQIKWGLRYIKTNSNFQTPCEALGFRLRNGWY